MTNQSFDDNHARAVKRWVQYVAVLEHSWRSFAEQWKFHQRVYGDLETVTASLRLQRHPDKILNLSRGLKDPDWLPGAELNMADSCFQTESVGSRRYGEKKTMTGFIIYLSGS